MTSSEEIRRRVREAEEQRIERRAQAAATVASVRQQREEVRQRLEELNRELAVAVNDAEREMTRAELASFLGTRTREVNEWASAAGTRRNRSGKRSRGGAASTNTQHVSETAEQVPDTDSSREDPADNTYAEPSVSSPT